MPQSPTNFLSFIAHRYQKKAEDVGTDVTAYLLGKSSGKQALRNLLRELGWYGLSSFDVRSRPRQEDGIPDLCLMQNEKLHVIVENKFWARLTPAQPCAYLDMVSRSNGLVLFVVPKERKQAVWSEILSRCSDASRPVKTTTSKLIGQSGKASLATISWEELVQCFQRSFTEETELVFVNELGRLANMAEKDQIGPLDGGTLGNTALAKQVVFYARLADAIADAAADKGYFVFVNALRKGAVGVGYSVKYGRIQRFENAWVGFDAHSWAKYGKSPVWIGFDNKSDIEGQLSEIFKTADLEHIVDSPDTAPMLIVPITLTPDVGQDELIERAVEQVKKIHSLLK